MLEVCTATQSSCQANLHREGAQHNYNKSLVCDTLFDTLRCESLRASFLEGGLYRVKGRRTSEHWFCLQLCGVRECAHHYCGFRAEWLRHVTACVDTRSFANRTRPNDAQARWDAETQRLQGRAMEFSCA